MVFFKICYISGWVVFVLFFSAFLVFFTYHCFIFMLHFFLRKYLNRITCVSCFFIKTRSTIEVDKHFHNHALIGTFLKNLKYGDWWKIDTSFFSFTCSRIGNRGWSCRVELILDFALRQYFSSSAAVPSNGRAT